MRDIYNEMLSRYGTPDPNNRFQHKSNDAEMALRIVEALASECSNDKAADLLYRAYDHIWED